MANFADRLNSASGPPRLVTWSREARLMRRAIACGCVALALFIACNAVNAWRAGETPAVWLLRLTVAYLPPAYWDWKMRRQLDLARRGEWALGWITDARQVRGGIYRVDFEFPLSSGKLCHASTVFSTQQFERLGGVGGKFGVIWDPRRPERCRPVVHFQYVDLVPAEEGDQG
jgi:hypothetical protein